MENENMKELLEKLKAAKSVEELVEMAKANGAEIPADEAQELFAKLNDGEISDDEAEAVAGGLIIKYVEIPEEARERIDPLDNEKRKERLENLRRAFGQSEPESIPCSEEMIKQIKSKKWGY